MSCNRSAEKVAVSAEHRVMVSPLAIVQAGKFPLWFQFIDGKPTLIESIEDAVYSSALVPWPLAAHVRFMLGQGDDILMAINRDGFICFTPRQNKGGFASIGLYRFSGGEFWQHYTVCAFVLITTSEFQLTPAALLYRDDRFFDSDASLPSPRLWTFSMNSPQPQPLALPALDAFMPEDGWDIDALRRGADGYWYFRAMKKDTAQPELQMLRLIDFLHEGEQVSRGVFQNAALPEPLSAAPQQLRDMLSAIFAESGCGQALILSPEFQTIRSFAIDREKPSVFGFFVNGLSSDSLLLISDFRGNAMYIEAHTISAVHHFSLPALPEGFAYTGIALCDNTIIASWEEQDNYSIGAAGFMMIER